MLEAFEYAKANVELWYEEQGRLASEHAGLDDNGDALFSLDPAVDIADGRLAEIAYIDSLIEEGENLSTEGLALKSRIQDLERSVIVLRGRKAEYLEAEYWQLMEDLLVSLSRSSARFNSEFASTPSALDSADESMSRSQPSIAKWCKSCLLINLEKLPAVWSVLFVFVLAPVPVVLARMHSPQIRILRFFGARELMLAGSYGCQ